MRIQTLSISLIMIFSLSASAQWQPAVGAFFYQDTTLAFKPKNKPQFIIGGGSTIDTTSLSNRINQKASIEALNLKANNTDVIHITGNEIKTGSLTLNDGEIRIGNTSSGASTGLSVPNFGTQASFTSSGGIQHYLFDKEVRASGFVIPNTATQFIPGAVTTEGPVLMTSGGSLTVSAGDGAAFVRTHNSSNGAYSQFSTSLSKSNFTSQSLVTAYNFDKDLEVPTGIRFGANTNLTYGTLGLTSYSGFGTPTPLALGMTGSAINVGQYDLLRFGWHTGTGQSAPARAAIAVDVTTQSSDFGLAFKTSTGAGAATTKMTLSAAGNLTVPDLTLSNIPTGRIPYVGSDGKFSSYNLLNYNSVTNTFSAAGFSAGIDKANLSGNVIIGNNGSLEVNNGGGGPAIKLTSVVNGDGYVWRGASFGYNSVDAITMNPTGNVALNETPTTSTSGFSVLTRNNTTGQIEQVAPGDLGGGSSGDYVPITGGTMTGNLFIEGGNNSVQFNPSAIQYKAFFNKSITISSDLSGSLGANQTQGLVFPFKPRFGGGTRTDTIAVKSDIPTLSSGTYVPTITSPTGGVTVPTNSIKAHYTRIANTVSVNGMFAVDNLISPGNNQFFITLPIASNLTSYDDLMGISVMYHDNTAIGTSTGSVVGVTSTDLAVVQTTVPAAVDFPTYSFQFKYTVK